MPNQNHASFARPPTIAFGNLPAAIGSLAAISRPARGHHLSGHRQPARALVLSTISAIGARRLIRLVRNRGNHRSSSA